jgi:hypothetical protein
VAVVAAPSVATGAASGPVAAGVEAAAVAVAALVLAPVGAVVPPAGCSDLPLAVVAAVVARATAAGGAEAAAEWRRWRWLQRCLLLQLWLFRFLHLR